MCRFASFILTKTNEYYLETSDSHEDIIEHYSLNDNRVEIVRVEIRPPKNKEEINDVSKWEFHIDQDQYPIWTYKGDLTLEEKTRKALVRRIEEQKIGYTIEKGIGDCAKVGDFGTAIVLDKGKAIAGDFGRAIAGNYGIAIAGIQGHSTAGYKGRAITDEYGISITGNVGKSISGRFGKSIAGEGGIAITGSDGIAIVGDGGQAIAGEWGKVQAGKDGELQIRRFLHGCGKFKTYIFYVGENNVEPNTLYRLENGNLVVCGK